jgi:uracil-DNA glycosylase
VKIAGSNPAGDTRQRQARCLALFYAPMLDHLLTTLAHAPVGADATNMYAAAGPAGNAIRLANLRLALRYALEQPTALLIVGEAPGYNGARRTGVPFTSDRLLLSGVEPPGLFGAHRGFQQATTDGRSSAEPTATLVWRAVQTLGLRAVGWNAYPFHPHRLDLPLSNRAPRAAEIAQGLPFLAQVCALFPAATVVAMGNVAALALTRLAIPHTKVRHPAQGGAQLFAAGFHALGARLRPPEA